VNKPSIILADEPTGDVDSKTGEQIMECIQDARRQSRATLVVVTHNPDLAKGADRSLHMKDGRFQ
jgi:putative ABC transport system ATP-binding protein